MPDDIVEELNDVIAVLKGGAGFYREAARKTTDSALSTVFEKHACERDDAVADLSALVESHAEEPSPGSKAEKTYAWFTKALTHVAEIDDTLVAQLEEHEDRTLETLRSALDAIPATSTAHASLKSHLETFRATHDHMRALKKASGPNT